MSIGLAVVLGILQGLTEFLPVSSSGHLALFGAWFGLEEPDLTFDILVHLATLAAIMVYFRRDWVQLVALLFRRGRGDFPPNVILLILVSMVPAGLVGIFLEEQVLWAHHRPAVVGSLLVLNGIVLLLGFRATDGHLSITAIGLPIVIAMGLAQACAIMPGISRSGATIMCAVFMGMARKDAARFSFLMAVPVIGGAGILAAKDLLEAGSDQLLRLWPAYSAGFIAALISGFLALAFLMRLLEGRRFFLFGFYCLALGALAIGTH